MKQAKQLDLHAGRGGTTLPVLLALALTAALALGVSAFLRLEDRLERSQARDRALGRRLEEAARERSELRLHVGREVTQLLDSQRRKLEETQKLLEAADEAGLRRSLEASRTLLRDQAETSERARGEAMASLREQIRDVDHRFLSALRSRTTMEEDFRGIEQRWDHSVFLIRCEFSYRNRLLDGTTEVKEGKGWGTGFVIGAEGYVVTNKHVVEPWKFDPEICALEAMGEIEVVPGSARISAWPAGCACVDDEHNPLGNRGYNNFQLKNLQVAGTAEDRFTERSLDMGSSKLQYRIHDLDDNDLALLLLEGGPFEPLPTLPPDRADQLAKLDPVMALGFPRGHGGLENRIAETSPSLGTIRKIENTIHVTASIIPGNSGGPIFNRSGEVIGVVTRIYSETLGICLKIEHPLRLLEEVRQNAAPLAASPPAAIEATGN